jgi:hypothetical protein
MFYLNDLGASKKKYKQSKNCPQGAYFGKRQKVCLDMHTGLPVQMMLAPGTPPLPYRPSQPSQFDNVDAAGIDDVGGGGDFYPTDFSQASNYGAGPAPYSSGGYPVGIDTPGIYSEAQAYGFEAGGTDSGGMEGLSAAMEDPTAKAITQYRDIALDTFIKTQIALGKRVDPAILAAQQQAAAEAGKRQGSGGPSIFDNFFGDSKRWTNALLLIGGAVAVFALYKVGKKKGWF